MKKEGEGNSHKKCNYELYIKTNVKPSLYYIKQSNLICIEILFDPLKHL